MDNGIMILQYYHVHLLLAVFLFRGVDGALEFASSDSRFPVMQQFKHTNYFK